MMSSPSPSLSPRLKELQRRKRLSSSAKSRNVTSQGSSSSSRSSCQLEVLDLPRLTPHQCHATRQKTRYLGRCLGRYYYCRMLTRRIVNHTAQVMKSSGKHKERTSTGHQAHDNNAHGTEWGPGGRVCYRALVALGRSVLTSGLMLTAISHHD